MGLFLNTCVDVVGAFAFLPSVFWTDFMRFSFLKPPPTSQTAEAPVRDKEFDSLRGERMIWVLRSVERERNTHWAGWRQSGEAGWRAAGRAAVHLMNGGSG